MILNFPLFFHQNYAYNITNIRTIYIFFYAQNTKENYIFSYSFTGIPSFCCLQGGGGLERKSYVSYRFFQERPLPIFFAFYRVHSKVREGGGLRVEILRFALFFHSIQSMLRHGYRKQQKSWCQHRHAPIRRIHGLLLLTADTRAISTTLPPSTASSLKHAKAARCQ